MGAGENSGHNGLIYDLDSGDGFTGLHLSPNPLSWYILNVCRLLHVRLTLTECFFFLKCVDI